MSYGILYSLKLERLEGSREGLEVAGQKYDVECNWIDIQNDSQLNDEEAVLQEAKARILDCQMKDSCAPRYVLAERHIDGRVEVRHKW